MPLSKGLVFVALLLVFAGGGATAYGWDNPPGGDPCSHGATGKPCGPDPQPDNGKDCDHHGVHGGVNEAHCGGTTTTPPTTTTTPGTTVTTPGTTTTLPGTTTTTPGQTTTLPGQTTTVNTTTPGATVTVTNNVAGPTQTVTVTGPTTTLPAPPAVTRTVTVTVPAKPKIVTRTKVVTIITKPHLIIRKVKSPPKVIVKWRTPAKQKCKPKLVACPSGLVGRPPHCGAAGKG